MINEDSYLLLDVQSRNDPGPADADPRDPVRRLAQRKYGSLDGHSRTWGGQKVDRDRPAEGRIGFRPLWNMFNEKSARDKDTAAFLVESQREFYRDTYQFLRGWASRG